MMQARFFHIDVNSAFLSWSAVKLLEEGSAIDIRNIPSIVGGDQKTRHGIVTAKSIPAKKYHIETAEPVAQALKKCPNLMVVSPDMDYYRMKSEQMLDYIRSICPEVEQASIDECYINYELIADNFSSPIECATMIKEHIKNEFGFTVNIGISDVKVLAKMASDFTKPDRIHTLYSDEIEEKMWPLPISDLFMCGKASAAKLKSYGIMTIGDLAKSDSELITSLLKSIGTLLWNNANGIDNSVVKPHREKAKSIGASTTVPTDITSFAEASQVFSNISKKVSLRLKSNKFLAQNICIEIKFSDFSTTSHQKQIATPTNDSVVIHTIACELFKTLWKGQPIRLLGIRATNFLDQTQPQQLDIFSYLEQTQATQKSQKADEALAVLQARFGDVIKKGEL